VLHDFVGAGVSERVAEVLALVSGGGAGVDQTQRVESTALLERVKGCKTRKRMGEINSARQEYKARGR
jgi:hypothetical protein